MMIAEHSIVTDEDALLVYQSPYLVSLKERESRREVEVMLAGGIFQPSNCPGKDC